MKERLSKVRDGGILPVMGLIVFAATGALAADASDSGRPQAGGFSRFRFEAGESVPVLYYDAYRPLEDGSRADVAVVFIHGWGGHVRAVLPVFTKALSARAGSEEKTPYVIAPMFPRRRTLKRNREPDDGRAVWGDSWANESIHPDQMGLAADDWRGGGDANGTTFSSYDYIDLIFSRFADRARYPNLKRVILAGFSAGGQFAGRYAATGKGVVRDGVKVDYIAMAPSTEFRFDPDQPWHYGLKGRPRYSAKLSESEIMANLCSRRVWRGCGSLDVLGRPKTALDMTPPAVGQGKNRFERFKAFERYLEKYPEWRKQVSFHVFEGIGHQEDLCYPDPVLLDFIFGPETRTAEAGGEKTR
jgi:pimeloyl-ACP methyl ester carboxylesterase